MQISDDIMLGPVYTSRVNSDGPSEMELGVGPMGRVYVYDVVPLALNLLGIAAAQAVAGAGNLTLTTAATGVTYATLDGVANLILDVPRNVDILSSSASDTATVMTIYGYDAYGQAMSEAITNNGTTRVAGKKAFKRIYRVAASGVAVGNISVGFGDIIGLPYRLLSKDYMIQSNFNATAVALSAVNAAVLTSPATTITGDVRGSIALPSAADGVKRLVAAMAIPGIACGPNATRLGALGVTQV